MRDATITPLSTDVAEIWGAQAAQILVEAGEIEARLADVNWRTYLLGHPVPLNTGLGAWEEMRLDQARVIRAALELTAP